ERARAFARDRVERGREMRLHQAVAAPERRAVGLEEDLGRGGEAREPGLREQERVEEVALDRDAVARERQRRRDQLGERELAGAEPFEGEREPRDRAGHTDAEAAFARFARISLAVLVEKDVDAGVARRRLAIVDGKITAAGAVVGALRAEMD